MPSARRVVIGRANGRPDIIGYVNGSTICLLRGRQRDSIFRSLFYEWGTLGRIGFLCTGCLIWAFFFIMSTLFERIISREIPAKIQYEDEKCIVIHDIDPQAPIHLLVVPKKVIPRVAEASIEDEGLLGHLLLTAARTAESLNLEEGYRVVINNGANGGETVPHLHVHVIGGRAMVWPPG